MIGILKLFEVSLVVFFTPSLWFRNYRTNKELSKNLFALIEDGNRFERISEHICRLGPLVVWTSSHPYASFTVSGVPGMPSRIDIIYLERILTNHLTESKIQSTQR